MKARQCDQMIRLFIQYWAIYKIEHLANCSSKGKFLKNTKYALKDLNVCQRAKLRQICTLLVPNCQLYLEIVFEEMSIFSHFINKAALSLMEL